MHISEPSRRPSQENPSFDAPSAQMKGRSWNLIGPKTTMAAKASFIGGTALFLLVAPQTAPLSVSLIALTANSLRKDISKYKSLKKTQSLAGKVFAETQSTDKKAAPLFLKPDEPKKLIVHSFEMHSSSLGSAHLKLDNEHLERLVKMPPELFGKRDSIESEMKESYGNESAYHLGRLYITTIFDRCKSEPELADVVVLALTSRENVTDFKIENFSNPEDTLLSITSDEGEEKFSLAELFEEEIFTRTNSSGTKPVFSQQDTFYVNQAKDFTNTPGVSPRDEGMA